MEKMLLLLLLMILVMFGVSVVSQQLSTAPAEKNALLVFKGAVLDPHLYLADWKDSSDPCIDRWTGIFCVEGDYPASGMDSSYQHVTEVRLLEYNLQGTLVPEVGDLVALKYFDVIRNQLHGTIPPPLGSLRNLFILTLSGNNFTGSIPEEIGNLTHLNRLQLDENQISGQLPGSFANLVNLQHMHLNNNSLEGPIPPEIGQLPIVLHILLDNNKLDGSLPPEIGNITGLVILQLDNNNFEGGIPMDYTAKLTKLTKMSLRNCGLSGVLPDFSNLTDLSVLDLSFNDFSGPIPILPPVNFTVLDLSYNKLTGEIPSDVPSMNKLQTLKLDNNELTGPIPQFNDVDSDNNTRLLDFQNNSFTYISLPMMAMAVSAINFDLRIFGNGALCEGIQKILVLSSLCTPVFVDSMGMSGTGDKAKGKPLLVTYRLKSPGFFFFTNSYYNGFIKYIAHGLSISPGQINIQSWHWQPGPRLEMAIVISPEYRDFNHSEIDRIGNMFAHWAIKNNTMYGPYELLGFKKIATGKGLSPGAIGGIVVGSVAVVAFVVLGVLLLTVLRARWKMTPAEKRRQRLFSKQSKLSMVKIKGVEAFTYKEMEKATDGFSEAKQIGRGGYGKVYRGILENGTVVAVKKAEEAALQRNTEFYNEIELLSRCHHRNLVGLIGYCNDEEEQMLVYEFMDGGTLHDNITAQTPMDLETRLRIALGSARGILYLHTEADPPIFHRDIKATNILLNDKKEAKVADFGLSRLAPIPDLEGVTMTHVSTVVKGTPGYLDPEYFLTHQLTDKSDVYSFGVVLLELLSGMQPISNGKNIVREIRQAYDNGDLLKMVDPRMGPYPPEIIDPFAKLALSCVAYETDARPSMQEVTSELQNLMSSMPGQKKMSSMRSVDESKEESKTDFSLNSESGSLPNSQQRNLGFVPFNVPTSSSSFSVTIDQMKDVFPR